MSRIKLVQIWLIIALGASLASANAIHVNQTLPSISAEPVGGTIYNNETLDLTWSISNFANSEYQIYMIRESENTTLVGEGEIDSVDVTLSLDNLFEGDYIFAFKLIYASGSTWSNVSMIVEVPPSNTADGSSDDGFLPGFTVFNLFFAIPLVAIIRRRQKTPIRK